MTKPQSISALWVLALAGFLPFAILAIVIVAGSPLPVAVEPVDAFSIWSLVILTFLGGIRWGMALLEEPVDIATVILSVVPCIVGWFALLLAGAWAIAVLAVLFAGHGFWDVTALRKGPANWFAPIRLTLTILVVSAHVAVLAAMGLS